MGNLQSLEHRTWSGTVIYFLFMKWSTLLAADLGSIKGIAVRKPLRATAKYAVGPHRDKSDIPCSQALFAVFLVSCILAGTGTSIP